MIALPGVYLIAVLVFGAVATADAGQCDALKGGTPGLYGLCQAFCGDEVSPPKPSVLENYNKRKRPGDPAMPCLLPPPPPDPPKPVIDCWTWTDEERDTVFNAGVTRGRVVQNNFVDTYNAYQRIMDRETGYDDAGNFIETYTAVLFIPGYPEGTNYTPEGKPIYGSMYRYIGPNRTNVTRSVSTPPYMYDACLGEIEKHDP